MKKVLALVLAVVMALGMTTVAFAATTTKYNLDVTTTYRLADGDGYINVIPKTNDVAPGKTLYFAVDNLKTVWDGSVIKDSGYTDKLTDFSNYKLSYSIDDGKNMIESVKFVTGKVDKNMPKFVWIAVKVKDNFITDDVDVSMTLKITSKSNNATITGGTDINGKAMLEVPISFTAKYPSLEDVTNGYVNIDNDGNKVTFDADADDVTLMFKKDVEVQGNMKGQKAVIVRLDTSNTAMEDKYPDATIRYFAGDKDTFRRDVTVTIPYDASSENPFLYVADAQGRLTKLCGGTTADKAAGETGAKYDDNLGAFVFKTKTLGNYVISDTELKNTTSDENVDVEKPTPDDTHGEPNPGTGANDFVGLAAAVAAISLAGIAVMKRSK